MLGAVLVAATALPSAGAPAPVRSGTILSGSGWFVEYDLGGCQSTPECAAWLQSDCDPRLSGHDPGLMASIVSVGALADGRTWRTFRHMPGQPAGLAWGGSVVQLWTADCTEIVSSRWRSTDCDGNATGRDCTSTRLRIPSTARWMTVTGYQDNVHLTWTLT